MNSKVQKMHIAISELTGGGGMKYDEPESGEWIRPVRKGYKMSCCDCGLVHKLDFKIYGDKRKVIVFRAFRDERATAQMRRHRKEAI